MSLFCFLWMPVFYFFSRSLSENAEFEGGVSALLLGSLTAVARFFLGSFINPGGFGLSLWFSGFVDIVCLPVLLPLTVYFFFIIFRIFGTLHGFLPFTLLWLIPVAAIRAVGWTIQRDPLYLVLIPLLWTALAAGIPFFIDLMLNRHPRVIVPASLGILALPFLSATVYWAFYSQRIMMGFFLLFLILVPVVIYIIKSLVKKKA
ncbi:MAG: hypothetical protein LBE10_12155 [Treponema sp.]|nr:hypothetical protein [Treponema sp.]